MKTNRFRVYESVTESVLCEGSKAKCEEYLKGLKVASPKVAPFCSIENYDDESGRWSTVVESRYETLRARYTAAHDAFLKAPSNTPEWDAAHEKFRKARIAVDACAEGTAP